MEGAIITDIRLLRLLQLSSASLPVGGYSFSQGLEYAIDHGWIKNSADVAAWLRFVMNESLAQVDLPLLRRLAHAAQNDDTKAFTYWNAYSLACRETMELRLTDTAMGDALVRLLIQLHISIPQSKKGTISFVSAFAIAATHWHIEPKAMSIGYVWSWLENQVAAATKLVPLGQTNAQQLLVDIGEEISSVIDAAQFMSDEDIGSSLSGLAMASSWHETQYSRLFRS